MQFLPICKMFNKRGLWQNREVISLPLQMPNKVGCVILSQLGSWVKVSQIASVQNNLASGICPFKLPHEGTRKLNPSRPERALTLLLQCPVPCCSPGEWQFSALWLSNHLPWVVQTRYLFLLWYVTSADVTQSKKVLTKKWRCLCVVVHWMHAHPLLMWQDKYINISHHLFRSGSLKRNVLWVRWKPCCALHLQFCDVDSEVLVFCRNK